MDKWQWFRERRKEDKKVDLGRLVIVTSRDYEENDDNSIIFGDLFLLDQEPFESALRLGLLNFSMAGLVLFELNHRIFNSEAFLNIMKYYSDFNTRSQSLPAEKLKENLEYCLKRMEFESLVYDQPLEKLQLLPKEIRFEVISDDQFKNFFGEIYENQGFIFPLEQFDSNSGVSAHLFKFYSSLKSKIIDKSGYLSAEQQRNVKAIDKWFRKHSLIVLHDFGNEGLQIIIRKMRTFTEALIPFLDKEKNADDFACFVLLLKIFSSYLSYFDSIFRKSSRFKHSLKFLRLSSLLATQSQQTTIWVQNKNMAFLLKELLAENLNYNEEVKANEKQKNLLTFKEFLNLKASYVLNLAEKNILIVTKNNAFADKIQDSMIFYQKHENPFDIFFNAKEVYKISVVFLVLPFEKKQLEQDMESVRGSIKDLGGICEKLKKKTQAIEIEIEDSIAKLINEKRKELIKQNGQPFLLKKLNKLQNLRISLDGQHHYFVYANEVLFQTKHSKNLQYHLFSLEFSCDEPSLFADKALKLGIILKDDEMRREFEEFNEFIENSCKVRMKLNPVTTFKEIPKDLLNKLKIVDSFLWTSINNDDLYFFQNITGVKVNPASLFRTYVKTSFENVKYLPVGFDYSKDYLLLCLLQPELEGYFAYDKYQEIENYIQKFSRFYIHCNNTKNSAGRSKTLEKLRIDPYFLKKKLETKDEEEKLIVQNITTFRKHQIKNIQKLKNEELRSFQSTGTKKKKKSLQDRKNELENIFEYSINEDDNILKVLGVTKCLEDYVSTIIIKGNAKHTLTNDDMFRNLCFMSEFEIFPLNFDLMLQLHLLNSYFIYQIRDFMKTIKFKRSLFRNFRQQEYSYDSSRNKMFLEDCLNLEDDEGVFGSKEEGYHLQLSESFFLKHSEILEKILFDQDHFVMKAPEFPNLATKPDLCFKTPKVKVRESSEILTKIRIDSNLLKTGMSFCKYDNHNNYQRLEFLGDAILKLLASIQVFCENPNKMEGDMTNLRKNLICNDFLSSKSVIFQFFKFVLNEKIMLLPPSYILQDERIFHNPKEPLLGNKIPENFFAIPNKALADIIESLTSVVFISNQKDLNFCQYFLHSIDILSQKQLFLDIKSQHHFENSKEKSSILMRKLEFLQMKIGYTFKNKGLLIQAFSHTSFKDIFKEELTNNWKLKELADEFQSINMADFSYERLEFLGDAMVDFFVCEYLFFSDLNDSPGALTTKKISIVNNNTLALISLYYDFDEIVLLNNPNFFTGLHETKKKIKIYFDNKKLFKNVDHPSFKMLADFFEAFIGALLIDSQFDFTKIMSILKIMMDPILHVK